MIHVLNNLIQNIVTQIQSHPESAQWIIFSIAFIESFALLGTLIPGTVLLTPVGMLLGSGTLPFTSTMLLMLLGAFLGDWSGYWIGRFYQSRMEKIAWVQKNREAYLWFQKFLNQYGLFSLVLGRFLGPLRSSVPFFAGLLGMQHTAFLIGIIPSVLLWAIAYLTPGFLISQPWMLEWAQNVLLPCLYQHPSLCLGMLGCLMCSLWLWSIPKWHRLGRSMLFALGLWALSLMVQSHQLDPLNHLIAQHLWTLGMPLSHLISEVFNPQCFFIVLGLWSAWNLLQRRLRIVWPWWLISVLSIGAVSGLKTWIQSLRPLNHEAFWALDAYSFPSGHVTLWIAVITLAQSKIPNWQSRLLKLGGLMIAWSRLSMHAHWASDVFGGWLLGECLANFVLWITQMTGEDIDTRAWRWWFLGIIILGILKMVCHV